MTTRIFVYGSLRRGEGNHRQLATSRFVGAAVTAPVFTLVDLGPYPTLITGGGTAVHGEVYEVDDHALAALDRLESVPRLYERHEIVLADGSVAHTYVQPASRANGRRVVASGDWSAYRKARSAALHAG